jgi:hypothetical protein
MSNEQVRILAVVDPHFSSEPPHSRKDDYAEAMFKKLTFLRDFALEHKVQAVVFTGDFSHKKTQPTPYVVRMLGELQAFPCQCWSVIGNHDVYAANSAFVDKTFLGILFASGALRRLTSLRIWGHQGLENDPENFSVLLKGYDFQPRLVVAPQAFEVHEQGATFKVAVTHAFLVKDQQGFTTDDVLDLSSFSRAGFDLMVAGHDHVEYPPLFVPSGAVEPDGSPKGMTVVRCGALSRGTKHAYQRARYVQACLLTFTREGCSVTYVPVPHAPPEEVFLTEQMDRENLLTKMQTFVETLKVRRDVASDIFSSLLQICQDPAILETCYRYLETHGFVRGSGVQA